MSQAFNYKLINYGKFTMGKTKLLHILQLLLIRLKKKLV